ncbi:hypothetical protein ZHAS_00019982 [Anopheles sinensis]|uniref:Uncharacterized protein n=1 Tax=Anopheles sinensis TaxID=74873 RepID=A0A084WNN2_ANOSI|nr:hypothetical protein ZHAS_00019982 [Anopheles sinensis]
MHHNSAPSLVVGWSADNGRRREILRQTNEPAFQACSAYISLANLSGDDVSAPSCGFRSCSSTSPNTSNDGELLLVGKTISSSAGSQPDCQSLGASAGRKHDDDRGVSPPAHTATN